MKALKKSETRVARMFKPASGGAIPKHRQRLRPHAGVSARVEQGIDDERPAGGTRFGRGEPGATNGSGLRVLSCDGESNSFCYGRIDP
jgi:hypothetical protein